MKYFKNESIFKGDNLEKLKAEQEALQKRLDENLQKAEPLSLINMAILCYGDKAVERYLSKNN